ncbi:protein DETOXIFICATION 27-like [Telopea speciosissima]|uniref:protein DETOXIFICATION 27-like n=1 Tax=Telopea speciosissima TaxID=54955 RepID=UPI001CC4E6FE|nr:protein DETOXIFICATION 27-like [Telopea speciosissima]
MREEEIPLLAEGSDSVIQRIWVESKRIWQIAGPAIFSRVALYAMTLISQAFAGHLGNLDLAAISIASTVIISISFGFLLGMASALETLCGQAYGAKQYHMLGIYLQRSWIVLFLFAILLLPIFVFATPILKLTGQTIEVAEKSGKVALWLIPLHFSCVFQFTIQRFLQCQLKTSVIAWVSGLAFAVHVFVSWFFVYRLRVGIVGIAIILDCSWWLTVLGLFVYTICGECRLTWTGFSSEAFVGLWQFLKLSTASGIMLCLENVYYRMLIIVSGFLEKNDVALDALSICMTIFGCESMIPLGFLAATGVRVANDLGAGNSKGAKFASTVSVVTSLVVALFFFILILAFHNRIALFFSSNLAVIKAVNELSMLLAVTILVNCIQPVLSGVAIGSGWQTRVAYINIGCYYFIGVPLGILLGWVFNSGIMGIWIGMIGGTVVQTLILIILTMRCDWEGEAQKATSHMEKNEVFQQ